MRLSRYTENVKPVGRAYVGVTLQLFFYYDVSDGRRRAVAGSSYVILMVFGLSVTACVLSPVEKKIALVYPPKMMGQRKGMHGYDIPLSSQDLFGTSLDIAGPLDMSMEGPLPRPGVNIHLQTSMKVDVYPVPQEG
ncbi:hypothetical protein E2C01_045632 [Portunus trituberculatus]|uniref:Uncharacterized protein n=1 Tax=Portunus trituberculatus TaxID=210409 RepID=A0A5B7G3N4_PORTR|nr:hypothetical protein [Portunus trituberculatus]